MSMKAYDIPVTKAALKMLKRDFDFRGVLPIHGMLLVKTKSDPCKWRPYLDKTESHQVRITIICRYASAARLYTMAQTIEHTFEQTMMLYIAAAVEHGMPAAEAINKFLDKYDLSEEDLKFETALKRWQRYRKKEKKRQFIPLW